MNELQIFKNDQFGEVRTLLEDGEIFFVAKDVAKILGYTTLQRMYDHVEKEDKKNIDPQSELYQGLCGNGTSLEPNKNVRILTIINESGLYDAVFGSELPNAKKFKKWVTSEVLPTIRKHGMYATEELINNPDLLIQVATELKKERAEKERLKLTTKKQEQIINELKPKADYTDLILKNKGLVTITQIAKDYGMSGQELNNKLHELKVQYKQSGQWLLYSSLQNNGYTHSETINITRTGGIADIKMITKFTQKGRLFLYDLLKQNYILPLIERN